MAAGVLAAPGTVCGPCLDFCEHTDCSQNRQDAQTPCSICSKPIGYSVPYYREPTGLVHAVCLEDSIERG